MKNLCVWCGLVAFSLLAYFFVYTTTKTLADTATWDFNNPAEYSYDPTKVSIVGGVGKYLTIPPTALNPEQATTTTLTGYQYETLNSFTETLGVLNQNPPVYQISNDGIHFYFFGGANWFPETGAGYPTQTTDANLMNLAIPQFIDDVGSGTLYVRVIFLSTFGVMRSEIDQIDVDYNKKCTAFTYSDWDKCTPNGNRTRAITWSTPPSCVNGNPFIYDQCVYQNGGSSMPIWMIPQQIITPYIINDIVNTSTPIEFIPSSTIIVIATTTFKIPETKPTTITSLLKNDKNGIIEIPIEIPSIQEKPIIIYAKAPVVPSIQEVSLEEPNIIMATTSEMIEVNSSTSVKELTYMSTTTSNIISTTTEIIRTIPVKECFATKTVVKEFAKDSGIVALIGLLTRLLAIYSNKFATSWIAELRRSIIKITEKFGEVSTNLAKKYMGALLTFIIEYTVGILIKGIKAIKGKIKPKNGA